MEKKVQKGLGLLLSLLLVLISPGLVLGRTKGIEDRGPLIKKRFIHYRRGMAKPLWAGGGGNGKGETKCYAFLAKGAKWKSGSEDYVINPLGSGLSDFQVQAALNAGAGEWNNYSPVSVFGSSSVDRGAVYDSETVDFENVVVFGAYPDDNVIAVTNVWGYFSGPPKTRELVEWDMFFNTGSSWTWGDAVVSPLPVMDLENIAVHELGHAVGLGHPDSTCTEETMYAYSEVDEIMKRDLNQGDIGGVEELYK